jgi:hypothetical protein
LKFLATVVSGAIVGAIGLYLTLNWQEEKLEYSLSAPAQFGDITYQSLRITNVGWNPATNVLLSVKSASISRSNVRASSQLETTNVEKDNLGKFERIRRDETITVSFSYSGAPISTSSIVVKSDRSVAIARDDSGWQFDWKSFLIGVGLFFAYALLAVAIPTYRDYQKRALQHKQIMAAAKASEKKSS